MVAAEPVGLFLAQQGMIAVAALGYVMEDAGQVQQLLLGDILQDLAGERKPVGVFLHAEKAHVLHNEQDVLVHRIDVEQVELHQALHRAVGRQIGVQYTVAVHAPEFVADVPGLADDLHEQAAVTDVVAEGAVYKRQGFPDQPYGGGAHALDGRVLLDQQEDLQQREGVTLEDIAAPRLYVIVADMKAVVEGFDLLPPARIDDGLLEQLQQHFIKLVQFADGVVILLHEPFDAAVVGGFVSEFLGNLLLVIEQQAILAPPDDGVQGETDPPQEQGAAPQRGEFLACQEFVPDQFFQVRGAEMALRHPAYHLYVAQAAGTLLDVGLQVVFRIAVMLVAQHLFRQLGLEEFAGRPDAVRTRRLEHIGE